MKHCVFPFPKTKARPRGTCSGDQSLGNSHARRQGPAKADNEAETWLSTAVTMPGLSVIPIDPAIAVESCSLPGDFHGDPADRLIVASARLIDATLITLDRQILDWAKSGWLRAVAPGNV